MSRIDEPVTVWVTPEGMPERLVWRARRYRVSDTPTRLGASVDALLDGALAAVMTHPPRPAPGWRFQGTDDSGVTRVFDIRLDALRHEWRLLRTYD